VKNRRIPFTARSLRPLKTPDDTRAETRGILRRADDATQLHPAGRKACKDFRGARQARGPQRPARNHPGDPPG